MTTCNTRKRQFKIPKKQFTGEWLAKTWNGQQVYGNYLWTDGTNIYYSYGQYQYVLNGDTWEAKTWEGLTDKYGRKSFHGDYIWIDRKGRIHYSSTDQQYVLDGDTWVVAQDNSSIVQYGTQVWTDGTNIFYSYLNDHYQYTEGEDFNSGTWTLITSEGLIPEGSFRGANVWTDGENIYYSRGSVHYVLNGDTWEKKTWNIASFWSESIWTDGTHIYCSSGTTQYVLNNGTWETMTWSGIDSLTGNYIWSDGKNIYYSNDTSQFYLVLAAGQTDTFYCKENGAWTEKAMSSIYQKTNGAWAEISKDDLPAGVNYVYREG